MKRRTEYAQLGDELLEENWVVDRDMQRVNTKVCS